MFKISSSRKSCDDKSKREKRNKDVKKMKVPKEFIKKIKNLGMRKEDADILYKTNINWTAVYSNNKIYCTEHGCNFFTKIDNDELTNHMINIHKYGEYPCHDPYCNFIAVSKKNLNYHNRMHTKRFDKDFCYKCPKPNCQASFEYERHLMKHIRAHDNDLDKCQYCPFRYINGSDYRTHMKHHFRIKDFKCDKCDKEFPQISELNKHYQVHEGILHRCLICNDYEAAHKISICSHLRRKHADVVGLNMNWDCLLYTSDAADE